MARTSSILTGAEIAAVAALAALNNSIAVVTNGSGLVTSSATTATQIGYLSSATGVTGTGNLVFSASPTLATPTLTTPTITNPSISGTVALASDTVFSWNSGDVTLTHSADTLTFTGTVIFDRIDANTVHSVGSSGILIEANNGTNVALFGEGASSGATFYGTLQVAQLVQLQSTLNYFGSNSVDGSDDKVVFLNSAGGGHSCTRGGYIYVVGNEFASEGGDVTLVAGDSSISGNINMFVYNGGFVQVVKIDKATGSLTLGSSAGTGTRALYAGAITGTSGTFSSTLTQTAGQIFTSTNANNFINLDNSGNMQIASRSSINNYIDYDANTTATALWNLIADQSSTPLIIYSIREDGVHTTQYTATTANIFTITGTTLTTGSSLRVYDNSSDTGVRRVVFATNDHASATGCIVTHLQQDSTGDALYIDKNSSGNAINIDADDNSASALYGIVIDLVNAGAGLEYAFRFNGSEVSANNIRISNAGTDRFLHTLDSSGNFSLAGTATFQNTVTLNATIQMVSAASANNYLDISNASGNAVLSSRGSVFIDVDADNNSTSNVLFVRFNAANYTSIFEEDGSLTLGTAAKTGSYALYCGGVSVMNNGNVTIANTNESTTLTNFTQALTNAGVLINAEYTANAYTSGIFWATSNDNSTKPKAGIWMKATGSGTYMYFGTSNTYATGITSTAALDYNGVFSSNGFSSDSTATTTNVVDIIASSLTSGQGLRVYSNSADASARYLMSIVNDHASAANTDALYIQQDGTLRALSIYHTGAFPTNGDGVLIWSTAANTAGNSSVMYVLNSSASSTAPTFRSTATGSTANAIEATVSGGYGLVITQNTSTSTNYKKYIALGGTVIWWANNVSPNGTLSGSAGDMCLSTNGNIYRCTGTTNWTAL